MHFIPYTTRLSILSKWLIDSLMTSICGHMFRLPWNFEDGYFGERCFGSFANLNFIHFNAILLYNINIPWPVIGKFYFTKLVIVNFLVNLYILTPYALWVLPLGIMYSFPGNLAGQYTCIFSRISHISYKS